MSKVGESGKRPVDPPQVIWLQWHGDPGDQSGDTSEQPDGVTFSTERVYETDVPYIRYNLSNFVLEVIMRWIELTAPEDA